MFTSSADILNWALALAALVLAFFLCWALYYVIASARRLFRLIHQAERGVSKAESLVDMVKEKVSSSASYIPIVVELLKKGIDFAQEKKRRKVEEDDYEEVKPKARKNKKK